MIRDGLNCIKKPISFRHGPWADSRILTRQWSTPRQSYPETSNGALTMALSFSNIKQAVAVDGDVNPRDYLEVEWALTTRCQPDTDMIVIPSLRGQPIDPSAGKGFATAKIGIDATRPRQEGFEKVGFPDAIQKKVASIINKLEKRG